MYYDVLFFLFVAGFVNLSGSDNYEDIENEFKEEDRLQAIAKQFGDENYPGWQSVHTYWDNTKELSRGSIKTKGIK